MSPLHILLIEDNDNLREATTEFLQLHGHRVTAVVCAEDIDDTPTPQPPDLYLIDVNLPGEDGFSLARRIRDAHPLAGIVLITARNALQDRLDGYACGADNYLAKPVAQQELLACIESLRRRLQAERRPRDDDGLVLDGQGMVLTGPKGQAPLTQTEGMLLLAMCRAAGQTLERWQAMEIVDPQRKGLVPANLEMRITTLRRKLQACGAPPEAIRTLRGVGYVLTSPIRVR